MRNAEFGISYGIRSSEFGSIAECRRWSVRSRTLCGPGLLLFVSPGVIRNLHTPPANPQPPPPTQPSTTIPRPTLKQQSPTANSQPRTATFNPSMANGTTAPQTHERHKPSPKTQNYNVTDGRRRYSSGARSARTAGRRFRRMSSSPRRRPAGTPPALLRDRIASDLRVLFVGINPGMRSARARPSFRRASRTGSGSCLRIGAGARADHVRGRRPAAGVGLRDHEPRGAADARHRRLCARGSYVDGRPRARARRCGDTGRR